MSNSTTYGLQEWDDVDLSNSAPRQDRGSSKFLKLQDGEEGNRVRILTKPSQFWQHKYKPPGDKGYGFKIYCAKAGDKNATCPLCEIFDKETKEGKDAKSRRVTRAQKRWLVGVIDRSSASYKILDISSTIFKAIKNLKNDEDYGDPIKYDISIKVDRQGGPTGYYGVTPKPAKPLSDADLELKDKEMDVDELIQRCQPPAPEDVLKRMESVANYVNKKNQENAQENTGSNGASNGSTSHEDSSDEEYEFPAVDSASV